MKKGLMIIATGLVLASCGGYSDEQGKAANDFCDCMEKDAYGDFDINYFECDVELNNNYDGEVFADEGWSEALAEKCPEVSDKMTTQE